MKFHTGNKVQPFKNKNSELLSHIRTLKQRLVIRGL